MRTLLIILGALVLVSCSAKKMDVRKHSTNFKDGVFENRGSVVPHSFWEILKIGLKTERAEWPEWVETVSDRDPLDRVNGSDMRITFINHATFLLQINGLNILTDPVFSTRASPVSFAGPKRVHKPGIAFDDLPKIDVVIISHDHYDHLDLDTIEMLVQRDNPKLYVGLGVGDRLPESANVFELDWWDSVQVADSFKLWFLEAQHFSGRTLTDRNTTLWGAFMLQVGGKKIYFGGDSGYGEHYKRTFERFGPMDVAFLPIGAFAPREAFRPVHLNPAEAVQAHKDLHANFSIGMHYGTFQMSAESRSDPLRLLTQAKLDAGIPYPSFITLDIGRPLDLQGVPQVTAQVCAGE